jgi:hypothetical protein
MTTRGRSRQLGTVLALALSLGFTNLARAEPVQVDTATERERAARNRYDEGVAAYQAGRFQQAIALFLVADELAPRAALAFNIARAYERLEDNAQALRYYREYLRREAAPVNMAGIRARIVELEAVMAARGVQQLTILSEPSGAFVSIDGQPRGPTPWTGELVPGRHQLTLLKEGHPVTKREIDLSAARAAEVNVELGTPQPPAVSPAPTPAPKPTPAGGTPGKRPSAGDQRAHPFGLWPWITLGAGGATLIGAIGFEVARNSAESDAESARTQIAHVDRYHAMESRQTAARVLAGVGSVLVAGGGVLLWLDLTAKESAPVAASADCTGEGCVASFRGAF